MAAKPNLTETHILVVDDEPDLRTLYELALVREGHAVQCVGSLAEANEALTARHFDVLITDMRLPDGLGMSLLLRLREERRRERSVVITAYGSAENAVEALKAGAFDYLSKPVDIKQFRMVVASAVEGARSEALVGRRHVAAGVNPEGHNRRRSDGLPGDGEAAMQRLAGGSAILRSVKERIAKVARSMAPVLVTGESGTGKELVARALHANSHRSAGPLVAVNCGAIPEQLLEVEFFGAVKGSFTGAHQDREGFFQAARGGSLFLDEIGELPLPMQSKLLRAIQERRVRTIGSTQEEPVDVRIISATHRDLGADVAAGRFRQDLFYRLNVIDIHVPPLRERLDDLPALCESLLERIAAESAIPVPALSQRALAHIAQLPLRGNVRELENLLHRAVALSEGAELEVDFLGEQTMPVPLPHATEPAPSAAMPIEPSAAEHDAGIPTDLQSHLDRQEREILVKTLRETGFNRTAAAARLGLSLRQIRYRIARLNIDMPQSPESPDGVA